MKPHQNADRASAKGKCGRRPRGTEIVYFKSGVLNRARFAAGLSVVSICDKMREQGFPMSPPTFYGLERGNSGKPVNATVPAARALCELLNLDFDEATTSVKPSTTPSTTPIPEAFLDELEDMISSARKELEGQ
jgi:hypothetical protein